jgi:hypothetical protein
MNITTQQIVSLSEEFGVDWKIVQAFLMTEGSGRGFSKDGKIKIQFEPHVFRKYTGITIVNKVDVQSKEYEAYEKAYKLDPDAAMLSTSWGIMQVMGYNHKSCGYDAVTKMVGEMKLAEFYQVKAGLTFIKNFPKLMDALKVKDWKTVARLYNGPDYASHQDPKLHYDYKLKHNYEKIA